MRIATTSAKREQGHIEFTAHSEFREETARRVARAILIGNTDRSGIGPFLVAIDGGESILHSRENRESLSERIKFFLDASDPPWLIATLNIEHSAGSSQARALLDSFINGQDLQGGDGVKRKLLGYLEEMQWGPAFAQAMSSRIAKVVSPGRWILVAPMIEGLAENRSSELVEGMLYLANSIGAKAVVFCECRSGLRSHSFCRIPAPVHSLESFLAGAERRLSQLAEAVQAPVKPKGMLTRVIWFITGREVMNLPVDERGWLSFITQCSYPDLRRVDEIIVQLSLAEEKIARWAEERSKSMKSIGSNAGFLSQQNELRCRAWFFAILYATFPEEVDKARLSLSGVFSLYGAQFRALVNERQLGVAGGFASWDGAEQLAPLFQRAMSATPVLRAQSAIADDPLVNRFPSASALRRHLDWQFGTAVLERAGLKAWEDWIEKNLRKRIEALAIGEPGELPAVDELFDDEPIYPEALLERAAWILDVVELERPSRVVRDDEKRGRSMSPRLHELLKRAGELVDRALALADASMRFEALIIRSRILALNGREADAKDCVKTATLLFSSSNAVPTPMSLLASLANAYVDELVGDVEAAPQKYVETAIAAENANVDEVLWRAVFGAMRCDLAQKQRETQEGVLSPAQASLRAQLLLQVQTARSPRLIDLIDAEKAKLFVSYRSESRAIVERLVEGFKRKVADGSELRIWFDGKIDHTIDDFAPAIQKQLSECRAALFIVSRKFWESVYCCCEMWFLSSRSSMTARQVPILWLVVDDQPDVAKNVDARSQFTSLIRETAEREGRSGNALVRFLNDVAGNRVLGTGTSVYKYALRARRETEDGPLRWLDEDSRIGEVEDALLEAFRRHVPEKKVNVDKVR